MIVAVVAERFEFCFRCQIYSFSFSFCNWI